MMMRSAVCTDAEAIVELFGTTIEASLADRWAYGTDGAARLVSGVISGTLSRPGVDYHVAEIEGSVVASLELRWSADAVHLNSIAVAACCRGTGVGRSLLRHALGARAPSSRPPTIQLDVFESGPQARAWYERLGLAVTEARVWADLDVPPPTEQTVDLDVRPSDLAAAMRGLALYGSAQLDVSSGLARHQLALVGSRWIRLMGGHSAADVGLRLGLARRFSERRCFAILSDHRREGTDPPFARPVARSFRMEGSLALALERLAAT